MRRTTINHRNRLNATNHCFFMDDVIRPRLTRKYNRNTEKTAAKLNYSQTIVAPRTNPLSTRS